MRRSSTLASLVVFALCLSGASTAAAQAPSYLFGEPVSVYTLDAKNHRHYLSAFSTGPRAHRLRYAVRPERDRRIRVAFRGDPTFRLAPIVKVFKLPAPPSTSRVRSRAKPAASEEPHPRAPKRGACASCFTPSSRWH